MSLPFLNCTPDADSYRILDGNEIIDSGNDEGGAPRQRADFLGATTKIDVKWSVGPNTYNYIRAFFRTLKKGALPFQINLIFETATPQLYTAQFVPGTFGTVSQSGLTYVLGATLIVTPQPLDPAADALIVANYVPGDM